MSDTEKRPFLAAGKRTFPLLNKAVSVVPLEFDFLAPKARHLNVKDVVNGSGSFGLLSYVPGQHLAGHHMSLVPKQILPELELGRGKVEDVAPSGGRVGG